MNGGTRSFAELREHGGDPVPFLTFTALLTSHSSSNSLSPSKPSITNFLISSSFTTPDPSASRDLKNVPVDVDERRPSDIEEGSVGGEKSRTIATYFSINSFILSCFVGLNWRNLGGSKFFPLLFIVPSFFSSLLKRKVCDRE